jgi:hypothetical protein
MDAMGGTVAPRLTVNDQDLIGGTALVTLNPEEDGAEGNYDKGYDSYECEFHDLIGFRELREL